MKSTDQRGLSRTWRGVTGCCMVLVVLAAVAGSILYRNVFKAGVAVPDEDAAQLYIPEGCTYDDVFSDLIRKGCLLYPETFDHLAHKMHYDRHVHPGKYTLTEGMSNRELLLMLRSGRQTPVRITWHHLRSVARLAGLVSRKLACDSLTLDSLLRDEAFLATLDQTPQTALSLFIPNTYQFDWNTSAEGFVRRMVAEYRKFWTAEREKARTARHLSQTDVIVLASIVEEETNDKADRYTVAGVYLNRLSRGMPLQADPTVRYALGDFTVRRILTEYLSIDSPYNTYKRAGLPPGPICTPSPESIDAVLFAPDHRYLYFCTAPDLKSLRFASTLQEHNRNAAAYRRELDRRRIFK